MSITLCLGQKQLSGANQNAILEHLRNCTKILAQKSPPWCHSCGGTLFLHVNKGWLQRQWCMSADKHLTKLTVGWNQNQNWNRRIGWCPMTRLSWLASECDTQIEYGGAAKYHDMLATPFHRCHVRPTLLPILVSSASGFLHLNLPWTQQRAEVAM